MSSSVSSSGPGKPWQPPTPEELAPELPQYEIISLLGRGGMGAVYKARQKSLKREVAIKVLPPTIDDGGMQFAERFKAEAEAMARLNHPGVVAVFDAGETPGGLLYIVMEFVEGTDVSQMIRSSGKLPPDYAYSITAHVCDALAYAHANGLIHRDIKPANIMMDKEGRVKVADFGLAKMTNENSGFTQTNMAVGTPDFVAPEALYPGVPLDGRADLYAVGVMLYQMLTGSIPRGAFKPASVIVPGLDARFDQIVLKAMQVDREERYSSAVELRQSLDTLLIPLETPKPDLPQQPTASAALPQPGMTGAQTVVAQRTGGEAAPQSRPMPQPVRGPSHSYDPPPKSKAQLILGLAAVAAAAVGAFVMLSGKKQEIDAASDEPKGLASAPTSQTTSSTSAVFTKDAPFTNTLGMRFVPVPDTQVLFCIHEVRYQDYAAYAAEAPSVEGSWKDQSADGFTPTENKEQHPVMKVSWEDAQKFCAWLSQKEGKTYRLPTDEEWSIAVGLGRVEKRPQGTTPGMLSGKESTEFPWGGDFPPKTKDKAGNYSDASRKTKAPRFGAQYLEDYDDGFPTTAPVMCFKPNKFGLYDMGGNVWEWCEDWFDTAQKDRVYRGGCWYRLDRNLLLSSFRDHNSPGTRFNRNGFRCVLVEGAGPAPEDSVRASNAADKTESTRPAATAPAVAMPVPAPTVPPPAAAQPASPSANLPPELAALDAQFIKLQAERVTAPFDADVAKLNTGYLGGIAKKIAEEKAAGYLDGILALEAEQTRVTEKQPLPETDDDKTPGSLKALRSIYRTAYAKLVATRAVNLKALTEPLDKRLATMESDFAKADRVADAKTVRGYREVLNEGSAGTTSRNEPTGGEAAKMAEADKSVRAPVTPAATLALKNGITNTLGMKFLPVKGTEVMFCIHEVRYQDYAAYAAETPDIDGSWKDQSADGYTPMDKKEQHPVWRVSWEDAQKFCTWLSRKEGKTYRLPTDEEWSIAVGLGRAEQRPKGTTSVMLSGRENTEFPWGGDFPPKAQDKAGNYSDASRKAKAPRSDAKYFEDYDDGFPTTAPVMSFKPNKFGLYDMGGNVWEWCEDWHDVTQNVRVLRGGSWNRYDRGLLLSSIRHTRVPGDRADHEGFRCVLVPGAAPKS